MNHIFDFLYKINFNFVSINSLSYALNLSSCEQVETNR